LRLQLLQQENSSSLLENLLIKTGKPNSLERT
jgi:hypothetical protein